MGLAHGVFVQGHGVEKGVVVAALGVIETLAKCYFADVGARAKGSTLHLPAPLVNEDVTFHPIDMKTAWVD